MTPTQLKQLFPGARADLLKAVVEGWSIAEAAGINTPKRVAMFLANIGPETGGLKLTSESLNYSADALIKMFGRHRISEVNARKYGRTTKPRKAADQEAIANLLYGGKWGLENLGNTQPGDGWKYRGGGMMQTTGRGNYAKLGFEARPEELRKPEVAFATAVAEWKNRGCNEFADRGDLTGCRKKINGGTNGLEEARQYYSKGLKIFAETKPAAMPVSVVAPDKATIKSVQKRLRELNYPEVGTDDGLWGKKTEAAILAFRNDNGLELKPTIDETLLAALMAATPREFSSARTTATAKDLADSKSISMASTLEKGAAGVIAAGGLGGLADLQEQIAKGRAIYDTLVGVAPWALAVVGGGLVLWFGRRFIREQVEAYRAGRHV